MTIDTTPPSPCPAWHRQRDGTVTFAPAELGDVYEYRVGTRGAYQLLGTATAFTPRGCRGVATRSRSGPSTWRATWARQATIVITMAPPTPGRDLDRPGRRRPRRPRRCAGARRISGHPHCPGRPASRPDAGDRRASPARRRPVDDARERAPGGPPWSVPRRNDAPTSTFSPTRSRPAARSGSDADEYDDGLDGRLLRSSEPANGRVRTSASLASAVGALSCHVQPARDCGDAPDRRPSPTVAAYRRSAGPLDRARGLAPARRPVRPRPDPDACWSLAELEPIDTRCSRCGPRGRRRPLAAPVIRRDQRSLRIFWVISRSQILHHFQRPLPTISSRCSLAMTDGAEPDLGLASRGSLELGAAGEVERFAPAPAPLCPRFGDRPVEDVSRSPRAGSRRDRQRFRAYGSTRLDPR